MGRRTLERTGALIMGAVGVVAYWLALATVVMALAGICGATEGLSIDLGAVVHGMVPSGLEWIGGIGEALRGLLSSYVLPMPLTF